MALNAMKKDDIKLVNIGTHTVLLFLSFVVTLYCFTNCPEIFSHPSIVPVPRAIDMRGLQNRV